MPIHPTTFRCTPEDIAIMGFWIDSNFSFQLITHGYRLDKDASAERTLRIEFLEAQQSDAIVGDEQ